MSCYYSGLGLVTFAVSLSEIQTVLMLKTTLEFDLEFEGHAV